ncbi:putative membrane protein [Bacteroides fragilis str. 3783N1-8]|nr:putative membrane protein [Bacteroides fragilis str. 3783N1-8]
MQYFWALVLILIILEYIYMKKMKKGTVQFIVLILIILEYIYIPSGTLYMIPSQLS